MKETFGSYIKKRRLELGLTQQEIAKKCGVAQNFIAYLENNHRQPSTEMIRKLGKILDLPSDKLYFLAHTELEGIIHYDYEKAELKNKTPPALMALKNDKKTRNRYHVTDDEIDQLASVRSRGEIRTKEDYIFLLMSIRQVFR